MIVEEGTAALWSSRRVRKKGRRKSVCRRPLAPPPHRTLDGATSCFLIEQNAESFKVGRDVTGVCQLSLLIKRLLEGRRNSGASLAPPPSAPLRRRLARPAGATFGDQNADNRHPPSPTPGSSVGRHSGHSLSIWYNLIRLERKCRSSRQQRVCSPGRLSRVSVEADSRA